MGEVYLWDKRDRTPPQGCPVLWCRTKSNCPGWAFWFSFRHVLKASLPPGNANGNNRCVRCRVEAKNSPDWSRLKLNSQDGLGGRRKVRWKRKKWEASETKTDHACDKRVLTSAWRRQLIETKDEELANTIEFGEIRDNVQIYKLEQPSFDSGIWVRSKI